MAKVASRYLKIHPFKIIEEGLHLDKTMVSESLFSLSNEYQGIRGFFDEGGSLPSLQGVYFNGIYEYALEETKHAYKGIVKTTHFMINSVNWVKCEIKINNEILDLKTAKIRNYNRSLSFLEGVSYRSFEWIVDNNVISLTFKRFLSMVDCKRAFQEIEIQAEKEVEIDLMLSLDSNVLHWGSHCYYEDVFKEQINDNTFLLNVKTPRTNQKVSSIMKIEGLDKPLEVLKLDKAIQAIYRIKLKTNQIKTIRRFVVNNIDKNNSYSFEKLNEECLNELNLSFSEGYEANALKQSEYWQDFYNNHDIEIVGDDENLQGIRFCLFQLQQTYHGFDPSNNIGAKGLTGEAYSGHAFWDTETYCLSYYLLNNIEAAKNLLLYRYQTLNKAKERAKMLDCEGACFPIATLNGEEACNLWQHASLQFQPSTAVAFAIFHYINLSHDYKFLKDYGFELLLEISKFLLSRGSYNQDGTGFGYYCVMGPDEFQMMVNHNAYTNYLAKKTFDYTLEVYEKLDVLVRDKIMYKCQVDMQFLKNIKNASDKMIILYDNKTKLFEQHDGYFKLPHIDINKIPVSEFPLYDHWSYDRIYRNDMIKQPDVLMFMFLYNQDFTYEQKVKNYEYYEPRCIHESSLSPSVHSILACEIDKMDDALKFFGFATRLDLDDYNRNTKDGLHTTSISASWSNIVYGFGGVRTDGKVLKINPKIPALWKGYSFKLTYLNTLIKVSVNKEGFNVSLINGEPIKLIIKDKEVILNDEYKYLY